MTLATDSLLAYIEMGGAEPPRFPTRGLVFWNPLDQWRDKAATGQSMTYAGSASTPILPVATTYKGVPCCRFGPNSFWDASCYAKAGAQAYKGTLSCWVASNQTLAKWKGANGIVSVRRARNQYLRYGVEWQNNQNALTAGMHDNTTVYNTYTGIANNTRWHHYCFTMEVGATEYASNTTAWRCSLYLDGAHTWDGTTTMVNSALAIVTIGQDRASDSYNFNVAGVRLYSRILNPQEIAVLAAEYTPEN